MTSLEEWSDSVLFTGKEQAFVETTTAEVYLKTSAKQAVDAKKHLENVNMDELSRRPDDVNADKYDEDLNTDMESSRKDLSHLSAALKAVEASVFNLQAYRKKIVIEDFYNVFDYYIRNVANIGGYILKITNVATLQSLDDSMIPASVRKSIANMNDVNFQNLSKLPSFWTLLG